MRETVEMTVSRAEPSSSPSSFVFFVCRGWPSLSSTAFCSLLDGLVMSDARLPVVAQLGGELDHPTVFFSSAANFSGSSASSMYIFICSVFSLSLSLPPTFNPHLDLIFKRPIDCPPPRRTSFAACLCWLRLLLWVRNTNHQNKKEKKKQPEGNKNRKLAIRRRRRRRPLLSSPLLYLYILKKRERLPPLVT
ncbi:hypothetical protein TRV_00415 [Trichophyton verrucosum HKI 0517]|uniref:Uncharacterized protein n=1 Tax=Trichophyton verrucosum (strain HKI 0517) TaxID=663202 RepID=D4D021_TRIVH|nr:uncharacterized protein TRV_00415 [Trichophyton verrucosum HKI 0517]EFE44814.1 hypothetical protein TRV_00415 [Trichophyton verrucosum HKI 0517]